MKPTNLISVLFVFAPIVGCDLFIPDELEYCSVQSNDSIITGRYIPEDDAAWVDMCDNRYQIQGPWFAYDDENGSTSDGEFSNAANGQFCFSGNLAKVTDWDIQWGGGLQFVLCQNSDTQPPARARYALAVCPRNIGVIRGMTATITGSITAGSSLRIVFMENGRLKNTYTEWKSNGVPVNYTFADAKVHYDASAPPINEAAIYAVAFEASPTNTGTGSYNFCISNISFY